MRHHPKNRLKLTGDTRLPDVMDLLGDDDLEIVAVELVESPRVYADGYVPAAMAEPSIAAELAATAPQRGGALAAMQRRMTALPRHAPWLAIGAALAFGWLAARMLRR